MQTSDELLTNSPTPKVRQKCESVSRQRGGSKDEIRYWKRVVRSVPDSPYLYIELQHGGIRKKISLETSNRAAAAHRARQIWFEIRAGGWPAYLAKYKPESLPNPDPSIGDFIDAVTKTADLEPKTLRTYIVALQKIVGDISGLANDPSKYGHGKARDAWREKLYAVRLSTLSADSVQAWKRSFLAAAGPDPISQRSARVSANSFLRCARSLFSPRIVKYVSLELPSPLPFASVEFESKLSSKYRSDIDIAALIEAARNELALPEPEVFKIFALATFAGLRRREIDLLPWSAFKWEQGVVSIAPTSHFSAKSEDSYSDVPLDREVLELFRGYQARALSEFVIESSEAPRPQVLYNYYRCATSFERLIVWLRDHGVRGKKPIHVLRKEFGSQLCATHGIYAASRGLRHSSIAISAAFYTDSKARVSVGLGHLLESPKIVEFKEVA